MDAHGAWSQARLRDGLDLLLSRPDDPEILHAVGVGLAHRGIAALDYERLAVSETREFSKVCLAPGGVYTVGYPGTKTWLFWSYSGTYPGTYDIP